MVRIPDNKPSISPVDQFFQSKKLGEAKDWRVPRVPGLTYPTSGGVAALDHKDAVEMMEDATAGWSLNLGC